MVSGWMHAIWNGMPIHRGLILPAASQIGGQDEAAFVATEAPSPICTCHSPAIAAWYVQPWDRVRVHGQA